MRDTDDQVPCEGSAGPERQGFWRRIRIPVAAAAALISVVGIMVAVFGLTQFNQRETVTGVIIIAVSTAIYITILARDRPPRK